MWFKKNKEVERESPKELPLLVEYIQEARNLMWEDEEIIKKFKSKNYPDEIIEQAFDKANMLLSLKKIERRKEQMAKKEEYEDEEESEEENFEDEEYPEEDERPSRPIKNKRPETRGRPRREDSEDSKEKEIEEPKVLTNEQLTSIVQQLIATVRNDDSRITTIEARFFRMLNS